jgi:23S rRNA (cytosine1962-C5)-methyltransferase
MRCIHTMSLQILHSPQSEQHDASILERVQSSLVCLDKPSGFSTHAPDTSRPGWLDLVGERLGVKLLTLHRLDKETSGCLLSTANQETAKQIGVLFSEGKVHKTYHFLSDRHWTHPTGKITVNLDIDGKPSETEVGYIGQVGNYHHYQANPKTGRTHQIRRCAQHLQIPILGDTQYGGSQFPRLALHAARIEVPDYGVWESPLPPCFSQPSSSQPQMVSWLIHIDRRLRQRRMLPLTTGWRLLHTEGGKLRMDQYGSTAVFYWYGDPHLLADMREEFQSLTEFAGLAHWWARAMQDRGSDSITNEVYRSTAAPVRWHSQENGLQFEIRADQGLSFGLFLDQKHNRDWVFRHAKGKTVLNLFCYTGGFSIAALAGHAASVTSVDLSRAYGEWVTTNLALNQLSSSPHKFHAMDAREYLQWAARKKHGYDIIVIDPPSFGRGPKGIFKIENEASKLIQSALGLLNTGGRLLFCTNFEKWDHADLKAVALDAIANLGARERLQINHDAKAPTPLYDHELPGEDAILKTILLRR